MTVLSADPVPLYVILREHQEYGPFDRETLIEALQAGNLMAEDWVRHADHTSCWTSIGKLLYGPPEPEPVTLKLRRSLARGIAAVARGKASSLSSANGILSSCSDRIFSRSGLVALACIVVATAIEFLPERPLHLSLPWMLAAFAAGVALILRHRLFRGGLICATAIALPLAAYWTIPEINHHFDPNRRETALPPIGEMYSSMPRRPVEYRENTSRLRSGVPALGLPQPAFAEKSPERAK